MRTDVRSFSQDGTMGARTRELEIVVIAAYLVTQESAG